MTEDTRTRELCELFDLLTARNAIDRLIADRIGRPALTGHIGEFIASRLFDIELNDNAAQAGHDGRFRRGPLAGRTVNIKLYAKHEGILDIDTRHPPDYYLVLAGPTSPPIASRGQTRPLVVEQIFLFETAQLMPSLARVKVGVATSVRKDLWAPARIYPDAADARLPVDPAHVKLLKRLAHSG